MNKLFLLLLITLSTPLFAADKKLTVDPKIESLCNTLGETYLTAYQKATDDVNYTDLLFAVASNYDGNSVGLYLVMHTLEAAYQDKLGNIERFHGAGSFKTKCFNDDLIKQVVEDQHKNEHVVEKIVI